MHLIRNTFTGLLISLLMVFVLSSWIEIYTYQRESLDMQTFAQLAAEDAIKQTQNLYLQSDQGRDTFKYNDYPDDFKQKLRQAAQDATNRISTDYCEVVAKQARDMGLTPYRGGKPKKSDTDLYYVLGVIDMRSKGLNNSSINGVTWNPLQFGLTYIDPKVVELLFRQNIKNLIEMNYGPEVPQNFWGWNRLEYNDAGTTVKVSSPKLVMFDGSTEEGRMAYETLFGASFNERDALYSQLNKYDDDGKRYDAQLYYCISYDLEFNVAAFHNTRTLAFMVQNDFALIGLSDKIPVSMGPPFDDAGKPKYKYLQITMQPTVFNRHYVFVN